MEFTEYERRYADYAEHLLRFAKRHNLLIEKYYTGDAVWDFLFMRPNGSQGKISLRIQDTGRVDIGASCAFDQYDELTRYVKFSKGGFPDVARSATTIVEALESRLRLILSWELSDIQLGESGYRPFWSMHSKAEFESHNDYLPEVIP